MENQREWTLGAHALRFEPPDILWVEFRGAVSLEEAHRLVELYRELSRPRPFFLVSDLREAAVLDQEVRRYFSENTEPEWILAVIYIGARLAHKAVARGLLLAAYLTGRADASAMSKVHFVSTNDQARELLARLREVHGGKAT
ncbi:hypothetical protein [Vitiosangium sp. GDMCC 1.1324]|uniref:hypothetical protein n=1 Tax=Vitiosangium sp. (strain GDMCC 1.1324) TaxID=2138576 RepID=UPI000D391E1D|nr:hypothetical protein [Vitiosangium sp. GDMCC 1.1324]PTL79569.1 hypothetical protein DAT35_32665 [Vitiosangium sp. GDMCC 1.1324]